MRLPSYAGGSAKASLSRRRVVANAFDVLMYPTVTRLPTGAAYLRSTLRESETKSIGPVSSRITKRNLCGHRLASCPWRSRRLRELLHSGPLLDSLGQRLGRRGFRALSEMFLVFLLARNARMEEDLVDQLFNSSERRLTRLLLIMAKFGNEGKPGPGIAKISQETLAEMMVAREPLHEQVS